ncbi:hypothetical protein EC11E007_05240, partial [Escherichia coli]
RQLKSVTDRIPGFQPSVRMTREITAMRLM